MASAANRRGNIVMGNLTKNCLPFCFSENKEGSWSFFFSHFFYVNAACQIHWNEPLDETSADILIHAAFYEGGLSVRLGSKYIRIS